MEINNPANQKIKCISLPLTGVEGTAKSVEMPIIVLKDPLKDGVWFDDTSNECSTHIQ